MRLNINSDAVVRHTNTLEKMHRSALPNAIRGTLNSAALDVKQNTMPRSAASEFTQRAPNFFRANSKVDFAKGWDVDSMRSTVGFIGKTSNKSDQAVDDLEAQEYGGKIESRAFIAMDIARAGGSDTKVRPSNRIGKIKNVVNSNTMAGKSPKSSFILAAMKAGKGGFVIGNTPKKTLWKIESINGRLIKKKPLFSYEKGRKVRVSQTGFMRSASMESGNKMDRIFYKEAQKQIERLNK